MGVSNYTLTALKVFPPTSLVDGNLELMEFMRYDTKIFRSNPIVEKDDLMDILKQKKAKSKNLKKQFLFKHLIKALTQNPTEFNLFQS